MEEIFINQIGSFFHILILKSLENERILENSAQLEVNVKARNEISL